MQKKMLLITLIAALALPAAFSARPRAWAEEAVKYTPGWRARVFSAPQNFIITESPPNTELASFEATKPLYELAKYSQQAKGAPEAPFVLWTAVGFLNVEEAGNYVFTALSDIEQVPKAIYIEDNLVATGKVYALMAARELEPGLYKIEFRIFGSGRNDRYNLINTAFKFLVKRPSDDRGLPISEVLLTPAKKK